MKLLGYSRYESKDGTKKGTWLELADEIRGYNTAGYVGKRIWAPYDIEIDDSLILCDVDISYKLPKDTKTGRPVPHRIFKVK